MAYWDELAAEYRERTPTSETVHEETEDHIPAGVASSSRDFDPYPIVVDHTEGATMTDVDGNTYIDFDMDNGAGMSGHTHPAIAEALHDQIDRGTLYTMPHELLSAAAKELKQRWSAIEKLRFTNSGTESTMHAIRAARAHSDRDKLVMFEGAYHGVHDYVLVSSSPKVAQAGHPDRPRTIPEGHGIPEKTQETVEVAPYNDLDAVEGILQENLNEVGAMIVEPVLLNKSVMPPQDDFLQGLRDLCDEHGVVLIFDEVKTGVKVAPGGAAEYYGIEPDLVTMAKSIGGETPIGAFGGKAAIMDGIATGEISHYGTYNGNPLVLRALVTALRDVLTPEAYDHVDALGERLAAGYEDVIEDAGLRARVESVNSQGMIQFTDRPVRNYREFHERIDEELHRHFWFGMVNQGVIPHPYGARQQWTISVQHTEDHIDEAIEAFEQIAPEIADLQE